MGGNYTHFSGLGIENSLSSRTLGKGPMFQGNAQKQNPSISGRREGKLLA